MQPWQAEDRREILALAHDAGFTILDRGGCMLMYPEGGRSRTGGITELKKIAAMAEVHYAQLAPHCPLSPLSFAASLQLVAAVPNFLIQEHNEVNDARRDGRTLIGDGYFEEPFELDAEGCVAVPAGPGLGVTLDAAGLERVRERPWHRRRG